MKNSMRAFSAILVLGGAVALSACSDSGQHARTHVVHRQVIAPERVQQIQLSLQQRGFYNGNADGIWGPATERAVQAYQKSMGMNPTGQLDSQTVAALNLPVPGTPPTMNDPQQTQSLNVR